MRFVTTSQPVQFARVPHPKEKVCGDDGAAWDDGGNTWLAISDGLGHGPGAATATQTALEWITQHHTDDVEATVRGCDRAIRHTRGISLNMVKIDRKMRTARYLSIGANLGWDVQRSSTRRLASTAGIVGNGVSKINAFDFELGDAGFLILASDGLSTTSDVSRLYSSTFNGNQTIAESLLDRWSTGTDDASVLVYRYAL